MQLKCPNCERILNCPDEHAGKQIACSICKTTFTAPPLPATAPAPLQAGGLVSPAQGSRYRDQSPGVDAKAALGHMTVSVDEFWDRTHEAWLSGRAEAMIPKSSKIAEETDAQSMKMEFTPKEFKCLHFLLDTFGPLAGEFLCGAHNECAITNYRLAQRDGKTKKFFVIPLGMLTGQIDEKGWWTKTATYHFTNGRAMTLSKMGSFVPQKTVMAAQALGDFRDFDYQMQLLIGNVDPDKLESDQQPH